MQKIRHISHYILIGLIPLILLMFVNASVNKHYHKLPNGEIIVHAHPFHESSSNSSSSDHSHSEKEYLLLALIGNPVSLALFLFSGLVFLLFHFYKKLEIYDFQPVFSGYSLSLKNKAPPVSNLFI